MEAAEFQRIYEEEMKKTKAKIESFPWHDKFHYAQFMRQVYCWSSQASDMLALAGARVKSNTLKKRFFDHVNEEFAHEVSAEKDVESCGYSINELPAFSETKGFCGYQYQLIEHGIPEAFFGYIFMLEGAAVECAGYIANEAAKINPAAVKFMKIHSEEDPDHLENAFKSLKNLDGEKIQAAAENLKFSFDSFNAILDRACESKSLSVAA